MGKSPDSSPKAKKNHENDDVMGYPTAQDQKYNQTQPMYPPPPPPAPKGGCESPAPPPSSAYQQHYPNPYAYNHYATSSPYQPYPPPYQAAAVPPYSPPPPPYYYQQQHLRHESDVSASFARILLILMFILLSSILTMSLIMWIFFGSSVPEFQVGSVRVSNFTATNTSLTGAWGVQMWVSNVNMELDVRFDHAMSSIFYKDSMVAAAAVRRPQDAAFRPQFQRPGAAGPEVDLAGAGGGPELRRGGYQPEAGRGREFHGAECGYQDGEAEDSVRGSPDQLPVGGRRRDAVAHLREQLLLHPTPRRPRLSHVCVSDWRVF